MYFKKNLNHFQEGKSFSFSVYVKFQIILILGIILLKVEHNFQTILTYSISVQNVIFRLVSKMKF